MIIIFDLLDKQKSNFLNENNFRPFVPLYISMMIQSISYLLDNKFNKFIILIFRHGFFNNLMVLSRKKTK